MASLYFNLNKWKSTVNAPTYREGNYGCYPLSVFCTKNNMAYLLFGLVQ